MFADQITFIIM